MRPGSGPHPDAQLRIRLPESFDFGWVTSFLAPRAVASLERIRPDRYRRALRLNGRILAIEMVFERPREVRVRTHPALAPDVAITSVARMLDLDGAAEAFHAFALRDPLLSAVIARGRRVRLPALIDPFECLIRAILGQQVSLAAATTLTDRLVRLAGERAPPLVETDACTAPPGADPPHAQRRREPELFAFPTPGSLRLLTIEELRAIGLPAARAAAVRAAASAEIDWERLSQVPGDELESALLRIRGVGPWTASYVRLRGLGDRDAFLAADLGVLKVLRRHAGVTDARAAGVHAERWRPWRGYAVVCLWDMLHGEGRVTTTSARR